MVRPKTRLPAVVIASVCVGWILVCMPTLARGDAAFIVTPTSVRQGADVTLAGNVVTSTTASTSSSTTLTTASTAATTTTVRTSHRSPTAATAGTSTSTTVARSQAALPCRQVIFESAAFAGLGTNGTPQTVDANVGPDGSYSQSVTLSDTVATGGYTITALCGATTVGTMAIQVRPLLPLSSSTYAAEQLWALATLVAVVLVFLLWRQWGSPYAKTKRSLTRAQAAAANAARIPQLQQQLDALQPTPRLLVGLDNRVSTSKCVALLWTATVMYGVLTLGFIAVASDQFRLFTSLIGSFPGVYLALLGGPFAAAVGARAIMDSYVPTRVQKPPAQSSGLFDIIADDNSNVDLVDTQYTLFNLVAVAVVLAQFIHRPGFGAPDIPWFLAALTGTAAATYLAHKALGSNAPHIDDVIPDHARMGQQVAAFGVNLALPTAPTGATTVITVGGQIAANPTTVTPEQVTFVVPAASATGYGVDPVDVVIKTNGGSTDVEHLALTVTPDSPQIDRADPPIVTRGTDFAVLGHNLFAPADLDYNGVPNQASTGRPVSLVPSPTWVAPPNPPAAVILPRTGNLDDRDGRIVYTIPANTIPGNYILTLDPTAAGGTPLTVQ